MDYGLLNAIGITVMCVFGLWAFYVASPKAGKSNREKTGKDGLSGESSKESPKGEPASPDSCCKP